MPSLLHHQKLTTPSPISSPPLQKKLCMDTPLKSIHNVINLATCLFSKTCYNQLTKVTRAKWFTFFIISFYKVSLNSWFHFLSIKQVEQGNQGKELHHIYKRRSPNKKVNWNKAQPYTGQIRESLAMENALAYSEHYQTSNKERFVKIAHGFYLAKTLRFIWRGKGKWTLDKKAISIPRKNGH